MVVRGACGNGPRARRTCPKIALSIELLSANTWLSNPVVPDEALVSTSAGVVARWERSRVKKAAESSVSAAVDDSSLAGLGSLGDGETTVVASGKEGSRHTSGGAERSVHTRVGLVWKPKDTQGTQVENGENMRVKRT